ncbi:nucleotide-binding universal stress UspA family protein [Arthrobacter sp. CAN_A6]|uniref:universal stress protein n=1 Tax=Arthrobacter sp. CAN_A6 TaxID=2787721 RepID=UPI0018CBA849
MSIVVGYIPTAEGEAALTRAIEETLRHQDRLVVVNSSRGEALVDNHFVQPEQAATLENRLQQAGIAYELVQPLRGHDAAEEVLTAAEEHQADLIVIGLRKRTPVGKMIMGSTAQRILLQSTCSVLAVKAAQI